jgi:hypothetical protein
MNIAIRPKQIVQFFTFISVSLALISFAGQSYKYFFDIRGLLLIDLFDVDIENNIPTLYSALLLFLCAVLIALIALVKQRNKNRFTIHWWSLSTIFLYLSLDESLSLHESLNRKLGEKLQLWANGPWDILNSVILIVFILAYTKFFLCLPLKIQRLFFLAGVLFVVGGIGIELVGEHFFSSIYHQQTYVAEVITTIEEFLEMIGITIFLYALVSYISLFSNGINLVIGRPSSAMPEDLTGERENTISTNRF